MQSYRASAALDVDSLTHALMMKSTTISATTSARRPKITAAQLAKRWKCGIETAQRTLDKTTQLAIRETNHYTGSRRLKPYAYQLEHTRLNVEMFVDILHGRCVSLDGMKYLAVYATAFHWIWALQMKSKDEVSYSLDKLFKEVGVPKVLIPDDEKVLQEGKFLKTAKRAHTDIHPIEAYT